MKKEVQKPSALMTKIEVLKFRLKNSYQIPAAHHLNMVLFKGCSKTDFVRYLNCEHRLCDEAVLLLIKAPKSEAFPLWLRYNQYNRLSPECETAYIKKFGILQLLKNGFVLSEEATLALLQKTAPSCFPNIWTISQLPKRPKLQSLSCMTKTLQLPIWAGTAFMKRIRSCFSLMIIRSLIGHLGTETVYPIKS